MPLSFLIDYITIYVDGYHHAKEEEVLFPWMLEKNPNLKFGPIGVMLGDHDHGRALIKQSKEYLGQIQSSTEDNESLPGLQQTLGEFIQHLSAHIDKEDNVLYQMAEQLNNQFQDGDTLMNPILEEIELKMKETIRPFID